MLRPIRYFVIIFAIVCQGILGVIGIGNLLSHDLAGGLYYSVSAFIAISGVVTALFMILITLTELAQKVNSTTTALFEMIWVIIVWTITTVEASYIANADIPDCDQGTYMIVAGKWNLCMAHTLAVPLSWAAAFLATTHLVLLVLLVEWHRSKASAAIQKPPAPIASATQAPFQRFWAQSVKPEMAALLPLLYKSVYVLLTTQHEPALMQSRQSTFQRPPPLGRRTFAERVSQAFSYGKHQYPGSGHNGFDLDERVKLRWQDDVEQPATPVGWTGSYYFQNGHPNASQTSLLEPLTPIFTPSPRLADLPRYQLRDEPSYPSSPLKPRETAKRAPIPRTDTRVRSAAVGFVTSPSSQSATLLNSPTSQLPPSPRSPHHRSRTMPSVLVPPRAQLLGRSRTLGENGLPVPSRYRDMDLSVRDSRVLPPKPPPGFLPNPTGRY